MSGKTFRNMAFLVYAGNTDNDYSNVNGDYSNVLRIKRNSLRKISATPRCPFAAKLIRINFGCIASSNIGVSLGSSREIPHSFRNSGHDFF